jgi:16S rRNA (adenine1518-N6/adenine1519-N6)-dimethyltransferase
MLQYHYYMERMFVVPPGAFNPPPKVDSAIVRMIPRVAGAEVGDGGLCVPGIPLRGQVTAKDPDLFARVVTAAFSQRRKMLRNTLREFINETDLAAVGIAPTARAEDIAVADYVRLANTLADFVRR